MNILEIFYYIGYKIKKKYSFKNQKRLPYPVISIGNITVGGTGKTPLVISLAEEAKKRGLFPIILTRGYKGKEKGPIFVSKNENSLSYLYGDEPALMVQRLKDVPVVKCADRYEGGMFAIQKLNIISRNPLFILDDGFQHWRLYRDLDILLIDSLNPFGNLRLLPIGTLREPLIELNRADIIVITRVETNSPTSKDFKEIIDKIRINNHHAPIYFSGLDIGNIVNSKGDRFSKEILKNKRFYAFCGIGNPESFLKSLSYLQGEIIGFKAYKDHHKYNYKDLSYIKSHGNINKCDFLITTEKDMMKLRELDPPDNLLFMEVNFNIDKIFFDYIFERIDRVTTTKADRDNISTTDHTMKDSDSNRVEL